MRELLRRRERRAVSENRDKGTDEKRRKER